MHGITKDPQFFDIVFGLAMHIMDLDLPYLLFLLSVSGGPTTSSLCSGHRIIMLVNNLWIAVFLKKYITLGSRCVTAL